MNKTTAFQKHFFYTLLLIRDMMGKTIQDAEAHLTTLQILILKILIESGGNKSQGDLIEVMQKDKSQVTRLLSDMITKGVITRQSDGEDKRKYILSITPFAHAVAMRAISQEAKLTETMLTGISKKDIETLSILLEKIQSNLKKNA